MGLSVDISFTGLKFEPVRSTNLAAGKLEYSEEARIAMHHRS